MKARLIALLLFAFWLCSSNLEGQGQEQTGRAKDFYVNGKAKFDRGDYQNAIWFFKQACHISSGRNPKAWFMLGQCFIETNNYGEALDCFEKSMKQDPGIEAHLYIADCLIEMRKINKAKKAFSKVPIDFYPRGRKYVQGRLFECDYNLQKALECYTEALGSRPWSYTTAWLGKARVEAQLKRYNEAINDYHGIIAAGPRGINWKKLADDLQSCLKAAGRDDEIGFFMYKLEKRGYFENRNLPPIIKPHGDYKREDGNSILDPNST